MKLKFLCIVGIIATCQLITIDSSAQQTLNVSGGDYTNTNGSVSFTIGQIDYKTHYSTGGTISEGVQQAYEIFEVSIPDYEGVAMECSVYPNPTEDLLQLKIINYEWKETSDYKWSVLDMSGKLIQQHKIVSDHTEISMKNLSKGVYFLNVSKDNTLVKAFKIIKN